MLYYWSRLAYLLTYLLTNLSSIKFWCYGMLRNLRNTWVFHEFYSSGKYRKTYTMGRIQDINTHTLLLMPVFPFHQIAILLDTVLYGKCMSFFMNFSCYAKMHILFEKFEISVFILFSWNEYSYYIKLHGFLHDFQII